MRENARNERNNGPNVSHVQTNEDQGVLTEINEIGEILPWIQEIISEQEAQVSHLRDDLFRANQKF